jgi:hypothetical protein
MDMPYAKVLKSVFRVENNILSWFAVLRDLRMYLLQLYSFCNPCPV